MSSVEFFKSLVLTNDLIIRDLGYVSLRMLETIIAKGAYFLNRFDYSSNAYETATGKEKIDLPSIQKYLKKHRLHQIEKNVFIGEKQRIPVRMIITLLPKSEIEKRKKKLKRIESKKQKKYTKAFKAIMQLNVYVTNISADILKIDHARQIYRLRWQIELVFKAWKSIAKLEEVKKMKAQRIETMLYAKLILLVLCNQIFWELELKNQSKKQEGLSVYKTLKQLILNIKAIKIAIKQGIKQTEEIFETLTKMIYKKCKLETKKDTISSKKIMQLK